MAEADSSFCGTRGALLALLSLRDEKKDDG